jgi:hypothetical protein
MREEPGVRRILKPSRAVNKNRRVGAAAAEARTVAARPGRALRGHPEIFGLNSGKRASRGRPRAARLGRETQGRSGRHAPRQS